MRVLIVDDDPIVRQVIRRSLLREGFDVVEAADADAALASLADAPVDVVVLDLHLPGTSGLDLLPTLRKLDPELHVLMLTAAASEVERVRGLVSGADDYMVKPFSHRELTARVIAVERRRAAAGPAVVEAGGLRIDARARRVTLHGNPVELTRREFDLLSFMASHANRNFTREELLRVVWGSSADWQSEATVTEHVRRLRIKTEADPAQPLRLVTVRGAGYRFELDAGAHAAGSEQDEIRPDASVEPLAVPRLDLGHVAAFVVAGAAVVHATAGALALVGAADEAEVIGLDPIRFVAPQSYGSALARQFQARDGRWARPEVVTLRRLDGRELLVEVASTPVLWDDHPATQVTVWDLAGETVTLPELATGIGTEVHEAIIVTDLHMQVLSFNAESEELYGWREEEVLGRSLCDVLSCARGVNSCAGAQEIVQRTGHWHGETGQQRRDGSRITVRISSTLLRNDLAQPVGMVWVNRLCDPDPAPVSATAASSDRKCLANEIDRGLERGEFLLHYQPLVRLDGTGWSGVEALVRWDHPELGVLEPAAFLSVAEQSDQLVELGELALAEACDQWLAWQRAGIDLHVSVNLSAPQLEDVGLPDRVEALMTAASMPPGALWLDVSESDLVNDLHRGTRTLHQLAEVGAFITVDDFGTGWASFAHLRDAPVHAIKIDGAFVGGLGSDARAAAIVGSVVSLGLELRLAVIAEGVETVPQVQHLRRLGCDLGQGYLFGQPQSADDLAGSAWLAGHAPA